ncbi:hypothetical protein P879_01953 [Paragonimus westermani]|uniref:Protein YIPF n=1 Tax=Paragonimus westermani TaxID=34504 RepID=A0A8T0DWR4_9TREM|nr:hypothetical protein P879_01953 [Paragonimus westermani]
MEFHSPGRSSSTMPLDGQIHDHNHDQYAGESLRLINEPIRDTVTRSVRAVGKKFSHVLCPRKGHELVKEWDLWGPLILCLVMSVLLHSSSDDFSIADGGPEFAQVFVIFWLGAAIVTLNSKLIGGAVSFLQTVCILGYCILPLVISLVFCRILVLTSSDSLWIFAIRLLVVAFGLVYSSFASFVFLTPTQPPNRVGMALYPICLLYFFFAWLVISVPSQ